MRKTNEKLVALTEIRKACLNERAQAAELSQLARACLPILQNSTAEVLEAVCHDPLKSLLGVKNIFHIGSTFFNRKAIKKLGCNVATRLIVAPLQTIQVDSCRLLNKVAFAKIDQGIELIQESCSLSVSPEVKQSLAECLPNYSMNTDPEITKKDLAAKEPACLEKINNLPIGERIKICDDFSTALHLNNESGVTSFVVIANDGSSAHDLNYTAILERLNNRNMGLDAILEENFLQRRVLEKTACLSLDREDVPFEQGKLLNDLIHRACFDPNLRSDTQEYSADDADYNDHYCSNSIEKLTKSDKKSLCNEPRQSFSHFKFRNFFTEGAQRIQRICSLKKEDAIIERIKNYNRENGIANDSLQEVANNQTTLFNNTFLMGMSSSNHSLNISTAPPLTLH